MRRILALLATAFAALALVHSTALAADKEEGNYMLGSQLVITSASQLVEPARGWWADLLPLDYNFGQLNLVNAVNASRKARGVTTMIDVKNYPIAVGGEMQVEGGWDYTIDFNRMSPEDVDAVLAAFPMSGKLADTRMRVRPLNYGYVYAHSDNGNPAELVWEGQTISVAWGESFDSVYGKVSSMLKSLAPDASFDLSLNQYLPANGVKSMDVSVSVYLNGATSPPFMPYAEGGM